MVEEEVDVVILTADFETHLVADEREPDSQLEQELAQVFDESVLQIAFARVRRERQEVEIVRILEQFLREIGFRREQRSPVIRQRATLSLM